MAVRSPTSQLRKYAEAIVKVGLNLHKGQRLFIYNGRTLGVLPHAAPLVYEVTRAAYAAGASYVDVIWSDEELLRIRLQDAATASLTEYSHWLLTGMTEMIEEGDALLSIMSQNPNFLSNLDPKRVGIWRKTYLEKFKKVNADLSRNATTWCVVAASGPEWAKKVYPGLAADKAQAKLWSAIFKAARIDQPDPVKAWKEHTRALNRRGRYLQTKQYTALHYRAPGTDLTLGLPRGHKWLSAGAHGANGAYFVCNMPTEEVFTLPDRSRAEGYVTSTMPLSESGSLIEDFRINFEKGRIVKVHARKGQSFLENLIKTDEGARHLGEVALVPASSPIARSGLLFYNTLFDENASCHLAIGNAYSDTLEGAEKMSEAEFARHGGNSSIAHVDFMIGSPRMDIDGIKSNGETEPVMRRGEWAFKV